MGDVFEKHRKRVWEHFGFTVTKDKELALFDVDWSIYWDKQIIAHEEDKAHYVDSCFHLRTIAEFAKTTENYQSNEKEVPVLILHSFTTYSKYKEKTSEIYKIIKPEILAEMEKKIKYTTLTNRDRIPAKKWFSNCENAYIENVKDEYISQDIQFIKSLIPL